MARKKSSDRSKLRKINPKSPSVEELDRYAPNNYVGTVIAPKSMIPLAIYASSYSSSFRLFSPNRKYTVGAGFFGDEEHECTRQHMMPGVEDPRDRGMGFGTALYIAGNVVVSAAHDDLEFPMSLHGYVCTSSRPDDRSRQASRTWDRLVELGVAEEITASESVDFEENIDPDEFSSEIVEHLERQYDNVELYGTREFIKAYGVYSTEVVYNILEWYKVLSSGLVLHLSRNYFENPIEYRRPFIPPVGFASLDWSSTTMIGVDGSPGLAEYAWQQIQLVTQAGHSGEDWLLETADLLGTEVGNELLDFLEEDTLAENPRSHRSPKLRRSKFKSENRDWMNAWGPQAFSENPDTVKRRLLRMRP